MGVFSVNIFHEKMLEGINCSLESIVMDGYDSVSTYRTDGCYSDYSYSLLEVCLNIKGDVYKEKTDKVREIAVKKDRQGFKADNLPVVSFSRFTDTRDDGSRFYSHTGIMSFDFDDVKVERIPELVDKLLKDGNFKTLACWTSCSGNGVRWIVPFDVYEYVKDGGDVEDVHERCYESICDNLEYKYGSYGKIDCGTTKKMGSLCFLSHDPNIYIAPCLLGLEDDEYWRRERVKFEPFLVDDIKRGEVEYKSVDTSKGVIARQICQAEANVKKIEERGLDITYEYETWYKLAFSFARPFEEKGRKLFHRLSALCEEKYNERECDRKYSSILNVVMNEKMNGVVKGKQIGFGTFCYYAKNALGCDFVLLGNREYGKNGVKKKHKKSKKRGKKVNKRECKKGENGKRVYNKTKITQKEIEKAKIKMTFLNWLPKEFETKHIAEFIEMTNLSESVVWRYVKEELNLKHIERVKHGVYIKNICYMESA
ncbi:MAG: PriCT-2 domain-containing protein [Paludibacteraceae bacterium]|nr:PriCT-2 domain-containing protein [Paludibacteraceae bacterium]